MAMIRRAALLAAMSLLTAAPALGSPLSVLSTLPAAVADRERALIEPLRALRMLRHSAWLAERWSDPTFPLNFPFFGSAAWWNQQTVQLREQIEAMQPEAR